MVLGCPRALTGRVREPPRLACGWLVWCGLRLVSLSQCDTYLTTILFRCQSYTSSFFKKTSDAKETSSQKMELPKKELPKKELPKKDIIKTGKEKFAHCKKSIYICS
jgi:hypothetical protein